MGNWEGYVKRYYSLPPGEQQAEWNKLTPEQRQRFQATVSALQSASDAASAARGGSPKSRSTVLIGCGLLVAAIVVALAVVQSRSGAKHSPIKTEPASEVAAPYSPSLAPASSGYKITGQSGIMFFVAVNTAQRANEDTYRLAVGEACPGKSICQVQFWVGNAPASFPLTDAQVDSKLVQWQQNLNTGLRRWLVKCSSSSLFADERECM